MHITRTSVDEFLKRLRTGDWQGMKEHYYAPDAVFAATVPSWHFSMQGADAVVDELTNWYPYRVTLSDVRVESTGTGAVISFERRWHRPVEDGGPPEMVGVRQMHVLKIENDRIIEHRAQCAGIWDSATFAVIEAEAPHV